MAITLGTIAELAWMSVLWHRASHELIETSQQRPTGEDVGDRAVPGCGGAEETESRYFSR